MWRSRRLAAVVAALLVPVIGSCANATHVLVVFSSDGVAAALNELGPRFERESGHALKITFGTTQALAERIEHGAFYDVAILTQAATQRLIADGHSTESRDLASGGIGIAVLAGAAKPDISSEAALKQALLQARSPAFTATGVSGVYFEQLLQQWGIAEAINAKAKRPATGDLPGLVQRHEVDLVVQQISELRLIPGIDFVGPLPQAVQHNTLFTGSIGAHSAHSHWARAWLRYLTSPAAAAVFQSKGMQLP